MGKGKVTAGLYLTAIGVWPVTTYAASVTLSRTFQEVPASAWLVVVVLALVSGLVSLLERFKSELMRDDGETVRKHWRWFVCAHLVGAIFMGLLSFLFAEAADIRGFYESLFIAALSYSGARATERMADGLTDGVVNKVVGLFGGNPPPKE